MPNRPCSRNFDDSLHRIVLTVKKGYAEEIKHMKQSHHNIETNYVHGSPSLKCTIIFKNDENYYI